ncbi:Flp pilus assembly complex ATPase component TadA [Escherichia coli]|nr:Flp pilus assembly complex ATPase component TadA [Escherichia coli]
MRNYSRARWLILVTGATGKRQILPRWRRWLAISIQHADAHILTLEDPWNISIPVSDVDPTAGRLGLHCMTFASGLRAALREDPDVILLGELRDSETIRPGADGGRNRASGAGDITPRAAQRSS